MVAVDAGIPQSFRPYSEATNTYENFGSFLDASQSGDVGSMRDLLPNLLADIKLNLSKLKDQVPELYKIFDEKKVEALFKQAEKNMEILEGQKSGRAAGLISKIFGGLSLVAAAVFFLAAPSPLSATFLVMSVGLFVDTTVADLTDKPSLFEKVAGKLSELLDNMDFMDSMPTWAQFFISSTITIAVGAAAVFMAYKGGVAALNGLGFAAPGAATAGTQAAGAISRQTLAKIANYANGVGEVVQMGASVYDAHSDFTIQKASAEINRLAADSQRVDFDSDALMDTFKKWAQSTENFETRFNRS